MASRQSDTDCLSRGEVQMELQPYHWHHGQWFEVEREEQAQPPRPYVYVLRPAPTGKILRGYQEYDIAPPDTPEIKTPGRI